MKRFTPQIMPGYKIGDAKMFAPVVYTERPNYHPEQITSIESLAVGSSVWRVHPGKYSSYQLKYNREYQEARDSGKPRPERNPAAVEAPPVIWYDRAHLERLKIIAIGMRVRLESGSSHIPDRVLIPDPNYFFAQGTGRGHSGPQGWEGSTQLSLTAEDVGMKPYLNSAGEERWSVSYLRPIHPDEGARDPSAILASRLSPEDIVRHIPGTEFLS